MSLQDVAFTAVTGWRHRLVEASLLVLSAWSASAVVLLMAFVSEGVCRLRRQLVVSGCRCCTIAMICWLFL